MVFSLYSLYAWGCPLVLVLVGVVLDAVQADAVRPDIDTSCWFFREYCGCYVVTECEDDMPAEHTYCCIIRGCSVALDNHNS